MYLSGHGGYTRHGEQVSQGSFLILVLPAYEPGRPNDWATELRAVTRYVKMRQLGQFMSGYAMIGARKVYVSGGYGSDGLPMDADPALYSVCLPVPPDIGRDLGKSVAGAEARLKRWARENHVALSRAGRMLDKPTPEPRPKRQRVSRRGLSMRERYRLEYSEARRIARGRGKSPRYPSLQPRHADLGKAERSMPGRHKRRGLYRPGVACVARPVGGEEYLRWLRNGTSRELCIEAYRRSVEWARKMRLEWGPVPLP